MSAWKGRCGVTGVLEGQCGSEVVGEGVTVGGRSSKAVVVV